MNKHVEIICGDEYRAKVESKIKCGTIFEEVCVRANEILYEIISENENYFGENFNGMGNNIIAFCGERGQGKTSAMQSYSAFLKGNVDVDSENEKFKCVEMDKIKECEFKVLDSIDPAALRSGVPVSRILLSRIFNVFNKYVKTETKPIDKENARKISDLFQKCFSNIDYLEKNNITEDSDLDSLARLGDSSELRKNLNELIELFFDITCKKTTNTFLVVQIDDADLSMANVYNICDNIHMYFTIPRVIVLFATDYEQLGCALKQNYLTQYKTLIDYDKDSSQQDEYTIMTSRYLEKMLPSGHIIWLPDLNEFITSNSRKLTISYKNRNNDDLLGESVNSFDTFQKQLLRLLYERTGIVLLLDNNCQHPFVPKTMRELTHMVKLLADMHPVDFNKAYSSIVINEKTDSKLIEKYKTDSLNEFYNIRNNIKKLKDFFIQDWCFNHLKPAQYKIIKEISEINRFDTLNKVYSLLKKKYKLEISKISYSELMKKINDCFSEEAEFKTALNLYFSIFLNEQFNLAVNDKDKLNELTEYLDDILLLPKEIVGYKKYNIASFNFSAKTFNEFLDKQALSSDVLEKNIRTCIGLLCDNAEDDGSKFSDILENSETDIKGSDKKFKINPEIETLRFDVLSTVTRLLKYGLWKNEENKEVTYVIDIKDTGSGHDVSFKEEDFDENINYLISMRNLISNYEVQDKVRKILYSKISNIKKRVTDATLGSLCTEIYETIDGWCADGYLNIESTIHQKCIDTFVNDLSIISMMFIANEDNRKFYITELSEKYKDFIVNTKNILNNPGKELDRNIANQMRNMTNLGGLFLNPIIIDVYGIRAFESFNSLAQEILEEYNHIIEELDNMKDTSSGEYVQFVKFYSDILDGLIDKVDETVNSFKVE